MSALRNLCLALLPAYGLTACTVPTPPVCMGEDAFSFGFGLSPPNLPAPLGQMNVVQPDQDSVFIFLTVAQTMAPGQRNGQIVGIKSLDAKLQGPVNCQTATGIQRVTVLAPFISVTYPPFGQSVAVSRQPFNFSQLACPSGAIAVAGELYLSFEVYDWCNLAAVGPCVIGFTPGRQISGYQGCPTNR
jgi:hypothetical protein